MLDNDDLARTAGLDRRGSQVARRMLTAFGASQAHGDHPPGDSRAWPHRFQPENRAREAKSIQSVGDATGVQARQPRRQTIRHGHEVHSG
jgi:hypothetical protein